MGGIYLFSNLASMEDISYNTCKPLIIFTGTYLFAELANYYRINKLNTTQTTKKRKKAKLTTLIF